MVSLFILSYAGFFLPLKNNILLLVVIVMLCWTLLTSQQILSTNSQPKGKPFGSVADVLFQVIIHGGIGTVLKLRLLNTATHDTIKMLEPHICRWFMRVHDIQGFDPLLTLDPFTGAQTAVAVHTLPRLIHRQGIAQRLARQIVPAVWGPFSDDGSSEMDFSSELRLAERLERGIYVQFHMADIARERRKPSAAVITGRLMILTQLLDEYHELPPNKRHAWRFDEHIGHVYTVLRWGYGEADIGQRRLQLRSYLDEQTEIDFHTALRMLRELMERMLLRHGPKAWHRDAKNENSVISWFLLKQSPRSLAKLFLGPQDRCCSLDAKAMDQGLRRCYFSDPLDHYWRAWTNVPDLGCQDCDCKRRARSWSVKPALIDARGREFNREAEHYLREMWSERHVGLHRAFTMGYFNTVL